MEIRLRGTAGECARAAALLPEIFEVVDVSPPYANRGESKLVRVFVEIRLDPPPEPLNVTCTVQPPRPRRRRALPPGDMR